MKKLYFISLVVSGILTAFAAIPGVSLVVAIFTIGIGALVLTAAANLFVVLLCLLPVALLPKRMSVPMSALLLAAAVFGPGFLSDRAAQDIVQAEQQADVQRTNVFTARDTLGLELIRPASGNSNSSFGLVPRALCASLCQRALHGGQVAWVRIITTSPKKDTPPTVSMVRRGDVAGCEETQCFVFMDPTDAPADITITLEEEYYGPYAPNTRPEGLAKLRGLTRLTVFDGRDETDNLVWRQTNLNLIKIKKPAFIMPNFEGFQGGGNDGGFSIYRSMEQDSRINPEAIAAALGLKLAPKQAAAPRKRLTDRARPTPAEAAAVASMLDQSGPIPAAFDNEIDDWFFGLARAPDLTPEEIDIIMRIADDPRFPYQTGIRRIFAKRKELQARMLPWLFDRMEEEPVFKKKFISWMLAELSSKNISTEQLLPYAPRYRALLNESAHKSGLLRAVGRFGFDPAPILRENYSEDHHKNYRIIYAICKSAPEFHAGLVPLARKYATDQMTHNPKRWLKDGTSNALSFLVHTGHKEEVIGFIKASDWANRDKILEKGFVTDHPSGKHDPKKPCGRM